MQGVKEQKVNHMKNIKKLTAEKAQLNDRFKTVKDTNGTLKAAIDAAMKRYQIPPFRAPLSQLAPSRCHAPRPRSLTNALHNVGTNPSKRSTTRWGRLSRYEPSVT